MVMKRKSAPALSRLSPDELANTPASKRRKGAHDAADDGPKITSEVGFQLLEQLKKSRDKQGSAITTQFLTLPDRSEYPQYYEEIKLPIALDTVEGKLKRHEYPTISTLEGDIKRMVSNAKTFNTRTSQIFSDAEKIRKLVSNFMSDRNPAYRDPTYQAQPTPIPGDASGSPLSKSAVSRSETSPSSKTADATSEVRSDRRSSKVARARSNTEEHKATSPTPDDSHAEGASEGFEGITFQEAQDKLVTEMMTLINKDNVLVAANFINLPSRALNDYYRMIKHPLSLRGLQKLVRGIKGHAPPTGVTAMRSWAAFEEEACYIWDNAKEYNLDTSEIVKFADELKAFFYKRLKKAKAVVNEPPQPRVKLNLGKKSPEATPKITLKFGSTKVASAPEAVVEPAPAKQQENNLKLATQEPAPVDTTTKIGQTTEPAQKTDNANGIKYETRLAKSPVPTTDRPVRVQSPLKPQPPSTVAATDDQDVDSRPQAVAESPAVVTKSQPSATVPSNMRQNGKDVSNALIKSINVSTHPDLRLADRFNLNIPASKTRTQYSVTIALPSGHTHLRIAPALSTSLSQRPSKTFVSCNNRRQQALVQREPDPNRPLYEAALLPGVNTIDVEVIAGATRGIVKSPSSSDVELEKVTIFAYLQPLS